MACLHISRFVFQFKLGDINNLTLECQYPIDGMENEFIEVATTRPETMLGDTGIAVHPNDDRYKHLVGKKASHPLVKRLLPIIADDYVDPEFGVRNPQVQSRSAPSNPPPCSSSWLQPTNSTERHILTMFLTLDRRR